MSIRVALHHATQYKYDKPVFLSPHMVRLRPAPHCRTNVTAYSLSVKPEKRFTNWQQDPYGNHVARLVFPEATREFSVTVDLVAEMTVINPFDFFLDKTAEHVPFRYDPTLRKELTPYLETEPPGPKLDRQVNENRPSGQATMTFLVDLNARVRQIVNYLVRLEPGVQTPEETLTLASGSCRDSAWLMVQVLRQLGFAARFVSGYLIQLASVPPTPDAPPEVPKDFADLHAWAEVFLPGAGWIGLDATSGLLCGEGHLPLACTAEPSSAAAITGWFNVDETIIKEAEPTEGGLIQQDRTVHTEFAFEMTVTRLHEDPNVNQPYTEAQWQAIDALGKKVDESLVAGDVRLTMGGEPTFVSLDDRDSPEWSVAAMGPSKLPLADTLARKLHAKFAPGGLLHHGQGKWYPGEPLPRWALGIYWRRDGQPIWNDPSLIAEDGKTYPFTAADAEKFIVSLAHRLDVDPAFATPGYEDVWYYIWRERRMPTNVDPLTSPIGTTEDRARLARLFEQGLDKIVGYALPLERQHVADPDAKGETEKLGPGGRWRSGPWGFRATAMYLSPGDSPMGFRLPLDAIQFVPPSEYPYLHEFDVMADRPDLPASESIRRGKYKSAAPEKLGLKPIAEQPADGSRAPDDGETTTWRPSRKPIKPPDELANDPAKIVRTALTIEARGGRLYVFMPPMRYLEDYLDLLAAVEDTAAELKMPLQLEGYTPPNDPRIDNLKVTPDPGVIEVNTQPSASWEQLKSVTQTIFNEARTTKLMADKFMIDGRHIGTGGGNHLLIGGATPLDSPLLRRPDLLRSLIAYWHNHPSLSYLFAGMFVGPTSQAPRMDEARNDQVYELELAFKEIDTHVGPPPPWLVDRVFRNLLVDSTGNTHRAEFCIDKLYTPQGGSGRLGLLELRAFEMPPHEQMSLTQALLIRAIVAMMWAKPYKSPLVRWRTELHDRFMLPHFVREDVAGVLADLAIGGFTYEMDWLAPHIDFRFPLVGTITHGGVTMELRQGIEPWHVLGEEGVGGGTVRYVDSSLERIQVRVTGLTNERHAVTCNGKRLPLRDTGTNGEQIAAVRYRAWRPAECLHPTVPVHAPLTFEIIDTWSSRSLGGCTYHVAHPGGRNYETKPINSAEAESRRNARFIPFGHTGGKVVVPDLQPSREFPLTLDLRWP